MNQFTISADYHQFYVADAGLEPAAPEMWTNEHVAQRHNTDRHIVTLCTAGDILARIIVCGPGEIIPEFPKDPDFEVRTSIEIITGKIGVFAWSWELQTQYEVSPGFYTITFTGFDTDRVDQEEDFYLIRIEKIEQTLTAASSD